MIKNINHGYTMDYFVKGVFLMILGICFTFLSGNIWWVILGIILFSFGISLLFVQTGVSIDAKLRRIRKLKSLFGFHFGHWSALEIKDKISLGYTNQTSQLGGPVNILDVQTKTFDLIISKPRKVIEIYEFRDYKSAKHCIKHLEEILKVKVHNRFEK